MNQRKQVQSIIVSTKKLENAKQVGETQLNEREATILYVIAKIIKITMRNEQNRTHVIHDSDLAKDAFLSHYWRKVMEQIR